MRGLDGLSVSNRIMSANRRDVLRGIGFSVASLLVAGSKGDALAAIDSRANGNPLRASLELDGLAAAPLVAVDGGMPYGEVGKRSLAASVTQRNYIAAVKTESLVLQLDWGMSATLAAWINAALGSAGVPRNGAVVYSDINGNEVKRLEFFGAAISEIALPTLDAGANAAPINLLLRIAPEYTRLLGPGRKPAPNFNFSKTVTATTNLFRLNIQGLEAACKSVSKVEALTAKRNVTTSDIGIVRDYQKEYSPMDYSVLKLTLAERDAGPFYAWFDDFILKGNSLPANTRAGRLEFLAMDGGTIAAIDFSGLGIHRFAPPAFNNALVTVPSVQVEMYCESMNLSQVQIDAVAR